MFFSISVYTTYLVHSCTQAAVVGKSYQKHFLGLKCGRGTLTTGLQRVKKTLLAYGVPDAACEDAALLRQVGEFFGYPYHLMDFKSILVNVERDGGDGGLHGSQLLVALDKGKPDVTRSQDILFCGTIKRSLPFTHCTLTCLPLCDTIKRSLPFTHYTLTCLLPLCGTIKRSLPFTHCTLTCLPLCGTIKRSLPFTHCTLTCICLGKNV